MLAKEKNLLCIIACVRCFQNMFLMSIFILLVCVFVCVVCDQWRACVSWHCLPCSITLNLVPLKQGLSVSLELDWQPEILTYPSVSAFLRRYSYTGF